MSDKSFTLQVVTVTDSLFDGHATELHAKGSDGQLVVLAHHEPFITRIEKCTLKIVPTTGESQEFPILSGVLEVADNKAVVLCSKGE
tara:strand:- start:100 stop:360 length:261 start_codon:yes stop_codon:yes gene_type:complete